MSVPKLKKFEIVVAAWPENASGPGWSNTLMWVLIQDANGGLRRETLQPNEQSDEMRTLFAPGAACAMALRAAAVAVMDPKRRQQKGLG